MTTATMTGKVLGSRVMVRQLQAADETESGILLSPKYQEKPPKGEVLMAGPKVENIEEGDLVHFRKYSGTPLELSGLGDVLIIEEADVLYVE